MLLLLCDIIFEKYVMTIYKWHKIMYARLRNVIIFVAMMGIAFVMSASWFMSMPMLCIGTVPWCSKEPLGMYRIFVYCSQIRLAIPIMLLGTHASF